MDGQTTSHQNLGETSPEGSVHQPQTTNITPPPLRANASPSTGFVTAEHLGHMEATIRGDMLQYLGNLSRNIERQIASVRMPPPGALPAPVPHYAAPASYAPQPGLTHGIPPSYYYSPGSPPPASYTPQPYQQMPAPTPREDPRAREHFDRPEASSATAPRPSSTYDPTACEGRKRACALSDEILADPFPEKLKRPPFEKYYGSTDPQEHLEAFEDDLMTISEVSESVSCKLFLSTLKDNARKWFSQLPDGCIGSFEEFRGKFLAQFATERKPTKAAHLLLRIQQRSDESLKAYVSRFSKLVQETGETVDVIKMRAFVAGLKEESPFQISLIKKPPTTFEELLTRSTKYVQVEQARMSSAREVTKEERPKLGAGASRDRNNQGNGGYGRRSFPRGHRQRDPVLPKLVCSLTHMANVLETKDYYRKPEPLHMSGQARDMSKFCKFHKDKGHSTDECKSLKFFIQKLLQEGHLKNYLATPGDGEQRKGAGRGRPREQRDNRRPPGDEPGAHNTNIIGTCDMIRRGPQPRGDGSDEERRPRTKVREDTNADLNLSFSHRDQCRGDNHWNHAIVIQPIIHRHLVSRVMVDTGSSVNILFKPLAEKLGLQPHMLRPAAGSLVGFSGEVKAPEASVTLAVTMGDGAPEAPSVTQEAEFMILDAPSSYNAIFGRPILNSFDAVISTKRLLMKFPGPDGLLLTARGNIKVAHECHLNDLKIERRPTMPENLVKEGGEPTEEEGQVLRIKVPSSKGDDRSLQISSSCKGNSLDALTKLLLNNPDVFAWEASEMPGIDRNIATHKLNVLEGSHPVKQKKRRYAPEISKAIRSEVAKLREAGFVREVQYSDWVSNVVMVKKSTGKWRMCVDFQCLNKACPKDDYPLPSIDALVDSAAGHSVFSFLDAFSGYHQIKMSRGDEDKTSFITDEGVFCYTVMPFGLKNAGATYQRLMDKIFKDQKGRSLEVYVDDILVRAHDDVQHLEYLSETFEELRRYQMKLNPLKCIFGAASGKFLGYQVSSEGISANPEKVKAVLEATPPTTVKGVRSLAGKLAGLSRFLSRSGEKCAPFFKTLRKGTKFIWDADCDKAFEEIKNYLCKAPLLGSPSQGDVLLLYLGIHHEAVSSVLVIDQGSRQIPVFYVSHSLTGPELNYPNMDKLALALITTVRKLRHYFQAHRVLVVTDTPLRGVMQKPEVSGRLLKWSIELSEFDIDFVPRLAIKAQVLADFVAEFAAGQGKDSMLQEDQEEEAAENERSMEDWKLYVDGGSGDWSQGIGVVLISPNGVKILKSITITFDATNNQAEYEALLAGLRLASGLGAKVLTIYSDSQLVVNQVLGTYEVKDEVLVLYRARTVQELGNFHRYQLVHIPREDNQLADHLAKYGEPACTNEYKLEEPSISRPHEVGAIEEEVPWYAEILQYLREGVLPGDRSKALKIRRDSARYFIGDGVLYKRSFFGVSLRCLNSHEARDVLDEIHNGDCGSHSAGANLMRKVLRSGYYWPTVRADSEDFARKCQACQLHGNILRQPAQPVQPITSPWPFAMWGMDFVGPLPVGKGQARFLLVMVDYFTKWVEVKPMASATKEAVLSFLWSEIFPRFGLPLAIITDNGTQFNNKKLREFCHNNGVELRFASVGHPQTNGQAEATNKTIINLLKKKLASRGGDWTEELPSVLWGYRTTPSSSTGETPFCLAFGAEAVTPVEMFMSTSRTRPAYQLDTEQSESWRRANDEALRVSLEVLHEVRGSAEKHARVNKDRVCRFLNKTFKPRKFEQGQLVLRKLEAAGQSAYPGKFAPNWDGPFIIKRVVGSGAYTLQDSEGNELPRTWNAIDLKRHYA